jgi:hypothetical protein
VPGQAANASRGGTRHAEDDEGAALRSMQRAMHKPIAAPSAKHITDHHT